MEAARCSSPATLLLLTALLLLNAPSPATCHEETRNIDVGQHQVQPMRIGPPAFGPESLAFDDHGDGPYTGVSNGRVLLWSGARRGWTEFAHNIKHETVAECAAKEKQVAPESACGRPLGLQFHRATGDLYFADAYLGLMRVDQRGGLAQAVVTRDAGGAPLNFANGVDVDQETGHVYFTDSSTKYRRSDYLMIVLTGDATGRLLRYDPSTGNATVLASGLAFPNGVALSADRTHLMVAETTSCRLLRHWLRGPDAGKTEPFAALPGYPDNVRLDNGREEYWVALNRDKSAAGTTSPTVAAVRVRAEDGTMTEELRGLGNATVSEVLERDGALWLGSVDMPYVGLFRTSQL